MGTFSKRTAKFCLLGLSFYLTACDPSLVPNNTAQSGKVTPLPNPSPIGTPGNGGDNGNLGGGKGPGGEGGLIQSFKPAIAVRAMGCITCHAQIRSNVITDFGYGGDGRGNNYFFGQTPFNPFSGSIYGDHGGAWSSAKIWGSVYVPKAAAVSYPDPNQANQTINTTLAGYLNGVVTAPDAMTSKPQVVEQSSVYIGAPTAANILGLAGVFPPEHPSWTYFPGRSSVTTISGLQEDPSGNFFQNESGVNFACDGDLIVDSVLFLNNLSLVTEQGCRIYTTHTVFIQGPITYVGNPPSANLQITSSRAIVMGMGHGSITINQNDPTPITNSVQYRLHDFWTVPGYWTREAGTTTSKLDTIVRESNYISALSDAVLQPNGRLVSFSRLFLNAPNIQSRYQGNFSGVIIGELFLGSLSEFSFEFDNVFSQVQVLPLLKESVYLSITP